MTLQHFTRFKAFGSVPHALSVHEDAVSLNLNPNFVL